MQESVLRPITVEAPLGIVPPTVGTDAPSTPANILDEEVIATLRELPGEGEDDLLTELIDLFVQDAPPRLDEMRRALGVGDARTVAFVAHSLKGSSANIGAPHMAGLCAQLERQGRAGSLEGSEALHAQIEKEFHRVCQALELERRPGGNGNGR